MSLDTGTTVGQDRMIVSKIVRYCKIKYKRYFQTMGGRNTRHFRAVTAEMVRDTSDSTLVRIFFEGCYKPHIRERAGIILEEREKYRKINNAGGCTNG